MAFWKQFKKKKKKKKPGASQDPLARLVGQGERLYYGDRVLEACKPWEEAWKLFRGRLEPEHNTFESAQEHFSAEHHVMNWSGDYLEALNNASLEDPKPAEQGLQFCEQFLEQFSEEQVDLVNFRQARAEFTLKLGRTEEAHALYREMVEKHSGEPWAHIFYADALLHSVGHSGHYIPFDKEKARSHLRKAVELAENEYDKAGAEERLEELDSLEPRDQRESKGQA